MALSLKAVAPAQGARWLSQGFKAFARRPFAFCGMYVAFLLLALLAGSIPYLGGVLMLWAMPLLSLAFMIATRSALQGGPVHASQFIEGLRARAPNRIALAIVCAAYAAAMLGVFYLGDFADGGAVTRAMQLMGKGDATRKQLDAVLADPQLAFGIGLRSVLIALVSVPFWHAPALVHWGGQGAAQALFSSALAVWRSKGAFTVYSLAWAALALAWAVLVLLLLTLLGSRQLLGLVAMPTGLVFSTVFYVSLWFTFKDSFSVD